MDKLTIRDIDVAGKTVLVRVDFNVPRDKDTGEITDDNRVVAALPTINYLLDHNPKAVVLFSHLGKIKKEEDKAKNDMAVVAPKLAELLGRDVKFVNATRGAELEEAVKNAENGQVILVQNTRYEAGETIEFPRLTMQEGTINSATNYMSDFWLINAWYIRLKTIDLGYQLPKKVLPKFIDNVRFYVSAYNLVTWTSYHKYQQDPEISSNTAGDAYMNQRVVNLGVQLSF